MNLRLFYTNIDKSGDCWVWLGTKNKDGYGMASSKVLGTVRLRLAHRIAYHLHNGELKPGLEVDHLCGNRSCVRPTHLEQVDHGTNVRRGKNATKTHCKHGHSLKDAYRYHGTRFCRPCAAVRTKQYKLRKAAA